MIVFTGTATIATLPFVAAEFAYGAGVLPDAEGWAIIGYAAIFPSILAQVFYIRGVELIGANRAGLFIDLVPIFRDLLSIVIARGNPWSLSRRSLSCWRSGGIWLAEMSGRKTNRVGHAMCAIKGAAKARRGTGRLGSATASTSKCSGLAESIEG